MNLSFGRCSAPLRPRGASLRRRALTAASHSALAPIQGKKQDYTYRLMTKVSAYNGGLVSPTGYYKLNVQGGQYTTFTYWWQARAHRKWAARIACASPNARRRCRAARSSAAT